MLKDLKNWIEYEEMSLKNNEHYLKWVKDSEWEPEAEAAKGTLWLVSTTGRPVKGNWLKKPSCCSYSASDLISVIKTAGSLSCGGRALVEFAVQRTKHEAQTKVRTLDFRKVKLQLFKELVSRTPCETALKDKGEEQNWQIFKDIVRTGEELPILRCMKLWKEGKSLAWVSKELLVKLRRKKEMHRHWKHRQVSWEEYRDSVRLCKNKIRKSKEHLELSLLRCKDKQEGLLQECQPEKKVQRNPPQWTMQANSYRERQGECWSTQEHFFFASLFTSSLVSHTASSSGF